MAKILIVDDEKPVREGLRELLSDEGFDADMAVNGKEALRMLEKQRFDLVLSDIKMPGLDGVQLMKKVREKNPKVDFIMITGQATIEDAVASLKLGAYDFIKKPYEADEIIGAINRNLEMRVLKQKKKERTRELVKTKRQLKKAHEQLQQQHATLEGEYEKLKERFKNFKFTRPEVRQKFPLKGQMSLLGQSALIEYASRSNFEEVIENIARGYLDAGSNVVLFSTLQRTNFYRQKLGSAVEKDEIRIVNMPMGGQSSDEFSLPMTQLAYFESLIKKIPETAVVVFTPLSQLVLNRGFKTAYQFVARTSESLSRKKIGFITALNKEPHDPRDIAAFEEFFMNIVEIQGGKLKRVK